MVGITYLIYKMWFLEMIVGSGEFFSNSIKLAENKNVNIYFFLIEYSGNYWTQQIIGMLVNLFSMKLYIFFLFILFFYIYMKEIFLLFVLVSYCLLSNLIS